MLLFYGKYIDLIHVDFNSLLCNNIEGQYPPTRSRSPVTRTKESQNGVLYLRFNPNSHTDNYYAYYKIQELFISGSHSNMRQETVNTLSFWIKATA